MLKLTFQYIFLFLNKTKKQLLFCLLPIFTLFIIFIGCNNKTTNVFKSLGIVVGLFFVTLFIAAFSDAIRNPSVEVYKTKKELIKEKIFEEFGEF